MKKILSFLLSFIAICSYAQDLNFQNTTGISNNRIALNELKAITHSTHTEGDGIDNVTVELKNGTVYRYPKGHLQMSTSPIESILSTSKFASMERAKEFTKLDELEFGDFVGVFQEYDYQVHEFENKACETFFGLDEYGAFKTMITLIDTINLARIALENGVSLKNIRIHVADIVYVGQDMNGQKIPLSARLIYPYNSTNNNFQLTNIYIDNHPTVFQKDTEPTTMFSGYSPCAVCTKGYLVIQPDLMGYGASYERTQQYIDTELNGSAVAYRVVAAMQYQKWSTTQRKKWGFTLYPSATIINAGASQGATTAMAGTYYIENKLDKDKYENFPAIKETRVCAGAYNLETSMEAFCEADTLVYACKIPMLLAGAITDYPEIFGDYTIKDYFSDEIMNSVYTNETGEVCGTIWQMLDRKAYSSTDIEAALQAICPSDPNISTQASLHKMMSPDLFNEDGTFNWSNPKMEVLEKFLDKINFSSTSLWSPKSPIFMVHGDNDVLVPYEVSPEFRDNHIQYSPVDDSNITLTTLSDVPEMGYGAFGPHLITCVIWYLSELTGINATVINTAFKLTEYKSLLEEMIANYIK